MYLFHKRSGFAIPRKVQRSILRSNCGNFKFPQFEGRERVCIHSSAVDLILFQVQLERDFKKDSEFSQLLSCCLRSSKCSLQVHTFLISNRILPPDTISENYRIIAHFYTKYDKCTCTWITYYRTPFINKKNSPSSFLTVVSIFFKG